MKIKNINIFTKDETTTNKKAEVKSRWNFSSKESKTSKKTKEETFTNLILTPFVDSKMEKIPAL